MAYVKTLRFPVPYGEPCDDPESGRDANGTGYALSHLGRILGVFIGDRVDLRVCSAKIKVRLQEGLDVGIGAVKTKIKTGQSRIGFVRGPT